MFRIPHSAFRIWLFGCLGLLAVGGVLGGCSLIDPQVNIDKPTPTPVETALPTDTPGPSPTPDPIRPDDIVYVRHQFLSLSGDVWLVHSDHSQPRQLTYLTMEQPGAHSEWPAWSPDHKQIAFASEFRDAYNLAAWNIFTVDPQGSGVTQLTSLPLPWGTFFPRPVQQVPGIRTWLQTPPPPPGTPSPTPNTGAVTGRVLMNGQPVEGATISSGGALTYTLTSADGRYRLENVPAGESWVKASQVEGADWAFGTIPRGGVWQAPDLTLDPRKATVEYSSPGWDPNGQGLWAVHTSRWLAPDSQPHFEPSLIHFARDGSNQQTVYLPQNGSLGPPRVNPQHPDQVAIADGIELVLLTTDLGAGEGQRVRARQVLAQPILRDSMISWSPNGDKIYYIVAQGALLVELHELTLATGVQRLVTTFQPYYQPQAGFDTSPDGSRVVYEQDGDLYLYDLTQPNPPATPRPALHITYFGGASRPIWSGR